MKSLIIAIFLAVATPAFAYQELAVSEQVDHVKVAGELLNMAVKQGQAGDLKGLVQHAQTALEHVKMAQQEKPAPNLGLAISNLEEAIRQGRAGVTDRALEHASKSLKDLDASQGALGG